MTMKRVFLQFCSIVQFTGVLSVIVLLLLWPARLSSRRWLKSERACVCVCSREFLLGFVYEYVLSV